MGNYKFRLSDMMPNAWFHKLKDMSKLSRRKASNTSAKKKKPSDSLPHSSISHLSNRLQDCSGAKFQQNSPRNSFKVRRVKRRTVYKPSPQPSRYSPPSASATDLSSKVLSLRDQDSSNRLFPAIESSYESLVYSFYDDGDDFLPPASSDCQVASWSRGSNLTISSSAEDIVIDMKDDAFTKTPHKEAEGLNSVSAKMEKACPESNRGNGSRRSSHHSVKVTKEREEEEEEEEGDCRIQKKLEKPVSRGRGCYANSPGIKLRANSPRIQVSVRRSVSRPRSKRVVDGFAVIKRSVDPKKDFRESMLEMIMENDIRASKDLEDLLACYLSLNPKQYHDVIVKVFEQIWFEQTLRC